MYNTTKTRARICRFLRPGVLLLFISCFSLSLLSGQGSIRLLTDIPTKENLHDLWRLPNGNLEASFFDYSFTAQNDSVQHDFTRAEFDSNGNITSSTHVNLKVKAASGKILSLRSGEMIRAYRLTDTTFRIEKIGTDNVPVWQTVVQSSGATVEDPARIVEGANGAIIVFSTVNRPGPPGDEGNLVYRRLDASGNLLVEQEYPHLVVYLQDFSAVTSEIDNACYIHALAEPGSGTFNYGIWKIDTSGQLLWKKDYAPNDGLTSAQANRLFVSVFDSLVVLDTAGLLVFKIPLVDSAQTFIDAFLGNPLVTSDGGIVAQVTVWNWLTGKESTFLQKWTSDGVLLWKRDYTFIRNGIGFNLGKEEADGSLVWIGGWKHPILGNQKCWLRTDANGILFDQRVAGKISFDADDDCEPDAAETAAAQHLVQIDQGNFSFLTTTSDSGTYFFPQVDAGPFTLTVIPMSNIWEQCNGPLNAVMPDSTDFTLHIDQSVDALADCPVMRVDIGTPFLRRCFPNIYTVRYCNLGSATAENARVDILLPPHLDFTAASIPVEVLGDTLRFPLDSVLIGDCDQFTFTVVPNCDSVALEQTLCVEARIFPDTICVPAPNWSGGVLQLSGYCTGDSVAFYLKNIGNGPTTQGLDFIVIEDHVITRSGELPALAPGAEHVEWVAAAGDTYRLIAMQEPNAPGASDPSIALEGCNGSNSFQHILGFPNVSGPSNYQIYCREVQGSFDPNDKQAFPAGVGAQHLVAPDSWVDYLIRFQNTGTDTAFTVVILDTLSAWLDPTTLRTGAASHAYTWEILDSRVLAFRFAPIALPDSNVNEPASHGFVQFRIKQLPGLPDGTLIENRAGIYFDFNEPVITNTVYHTVGRDFLPTVSINNPPTYTSSGFDLYPNPAEGSVFAVFKQEKSQSGTFTLFDALGRIMWTGKAGGQSTEIRRNALQPGLYWLRWEGSDGAVEVVKFVWQ